MRSAIREVVDDFPHALLTAAGIAIFMSGVIAVLIIFATPIPDVLQ